MAIQQLPVPSSETVTYGYAGAQAGTFALTTPLVAGTYLIETDASQTYTIGLANSTYGFKFTSTVRGGSGMVVANYAVDQIVFPTGITFPVAVKITTISQPRIGAITSPAFSWDNPKTTGDFTCSAFPAGATGLGIWLDNGTFYSTTSTSTSQANIAIAAPPVANASGVPMLVAAKGSDGNYGTGVLFTSGAVPSNTIVQQYTSSTTFLAPFTGNIELLVVAGGGGGSYTNYAAAGGGAGGGGLRYFATSAIVAGTTYTVTVGNGGAQGSPGSQGGNSAFGAISATGGGAGGGPDYSSPGYSGGSGGGAPGAGNSSFNAGGAGSGNVGGYSPVEGYAGGGGALANVSTTGGGGGGATGVGGTRNNTAGPGYTSSITGTSAVYSAGGSGGDGNGGTASGRGTGGKGGGYYNVAGQAGAPGIVVVKYTF
jgi:hypothetical protein